MRTRNTILVALSALSALGADCDSIDNPDGGPGEGEGEVVEDCIIGDPDAPADAAELALVYRTVDGQIADLADGDEVPLILPPQGGKVTLIGVKAKNVTCRLLLNGGLSDSLCGGSIIGREGRPVELEEGEGGFGFPAAPDTLQNYVNIPVCPTFGSTRDGDGQPYVLELRATEARRQGEDTARTHVLSATVTPVCAEPDILEDCRCECDADLILEIDRAKQCPTIHDNDIEPGTCPATEE